MAADFSTGEFFHYSYDAVGNHLTQETLAGTNAYDIANRLIEVDGVPYTWDDNGNLVDDGLREYAYDHVNRLTSVEMGDDTFEFEYSGLGDRLRQTVNGEPIEYTLDLAAGLTQVLSDGGNTYLYGVARIGEQQPDGWQYHLGDALGSVRQLADPSNSVGSARAYQPFGTPLTSNGDAGTVYGFVGEQADSTRLVFLRARYYVASDGRFVNRDPRRADTSIPSTLNAWQYVAANPINAADPSGLTTLWCSSWKNFGLSQPCYRSGLANLTPQTGGQLPFDARSGSRLISPTVLPTCDSSSISPRPLLIAGQLRIIGAPVPRAPDPTGGIVDPDMVFDCVMAGIGTIATGVGVAGLGLGQSEITAVALVVDFVVTLVNVVRTEDAFSDAEISQIRRWALHVTSVVGLLPVNYGLASSIVNLILTCTGVDIADFSPPT